MSQVIGHTGRKPKRQSLRQYASEVTAAHTPLAHSGYASHVRFLLQRAYRIGLNNGKLLAHKSDELVSKNLGEKA